MKTLLIVDDEKKIREGLKVMIGRFDTPFTSILCAKNGKEALEIIQSQKVDVVFTDIVMPIMDGLALMKAISQLPQNKPLTVVLSGFDDFTYAKEAIEYGVKSYLLKPVDRGELERILLQLEKDLQQSTSKTINTDPENKWEGHMTQDLLNYTFTECLEDEEKLKKKMKKLNINVFQQRFYLSILMYKQDPDHPLDISIVSALGKTYKDFDEAVFLVGPKKYWVMISPQPPGQDFIQYLNTAFQVDWMVGVSHLGTHVHEQYLQAEEACKYRVLIKNPVIFYGDIKDRKVIPIPQTKIKKIGTLILVGKIMEACTLLDDLFKENDLSVAYYETVFSEIVAQISESIPLMKEGVKKHLDALQNMYGFDTMEQYIMELKRFFILLAHKGTETEGDLNMITSIENALRYIQQYYDRDIDLAMVSNHVSLNYFYFSQLFKNAMGQTFTEYLKNVRIEKSKELLSTTDIKIIEIAPKVGFVNPKHFMKVFRSTTGISAKEYRKIYLQKKQKEHGYEP